ncbi:MAG: TldD/PmbA family protein [Chloroflexi bacterium]|nr:TldD/PmbA family protein [Chloroflexota bacterium]
MATLRTLGYDAVVHALLDEARRQGVFAIGRIQDVRDRSLVANNGRLERVASGQAAGLGVHAFTPEGWCGFASTDQLRPEDGRDAVRRAAELARLSGPVGAEQNRMVFSLKAEAERLVPHHARDLDETSMDEQRLALLEAHQRARALAEDFAVRSGHAVMDEQWRIVRSDGTDVSFALPHAFARHDFTARSSAGTASSGCSVSGADASVLLGAESFARLQRRAQVAVARARAVLGAPQVRGGSYKLVIDYALAKGLAHEAFGHASETDGAESSILAREGTLRLGEVVARRGLSIVDGPIEGDYAYQPISANGSPRQIVHIIRNGVLESGLGDLFSAARAGSPITGADRAESYRSRPLPRMSNIRIVVDHPVPLAGDSDTTSPEELRDALLEAGLMSPGEQVLYLSGYRGGQVNPKLGEFVFNCTAIFDLTEGAAPRPPAVFSGKSLSALRSILAGLGALQLDAMGHCGKGGQSVPSSGGSHAFVVLDRNPEVLIGGS